MVRRGIHVVFQCGSLFTLLHELAHVWDNHVLTDSTRSEFLAMRQADSWSNPGKWDRAGGEHLADIIAWGLHPDHPRPSRIKPNDNESLVTSFCVATGRHRLDEGRLQSLAQLHCDPTEDR